MLSRLLIPALLLATPALAQSNSFDLQSANRSIGRATYTLAKAKSGYKLSARYSTHIAGNDDDFDDEFKLSDTYAYLEGSTSNIATQLHTSYVPNKPRTEMVIGMVQAGVQDSRHLVIKPDFIVMPPYDPGAAQVMLSLATAHPTASSLYNIVVPAGSSRASSPDPDAAPSTPQQGGNNAYDALWTKGPDTTGTLDGKPLALHTYVLTAGRATWTFFADDAATLMQCNVSTLKTSYVRTKFKLDPTP